MLAFICIYFWIILGYIALIKNCILNKEVPLMLRFIVLYFLVSYAAVMIFDL